MYRCESWTIKKAECQKFDAFKLWCWRRLLRAPWTARISNQSILKEINPECSLEGLMLKLQYLGHLMQRANSLEKILMLGKIEGRRRRGWQRMKWLDGITSSMDMNLSKLWEIVKNREVSRAAVHGVVKSRMGLRDLTRTANVFSYARSWLQHVGSSDLTRNPTGPLHCKGRKKEGQKKRKKKKNFLLWKICWTLNTQNQLPQSSVLRWSYLPRFYILLKQIRNISYLSGNISIYISKGQGLSFFKHNYITTITSKN